MNKQQSKLSSNNLVQKFRNASPLLKVAITWGLWATVTLTGYYFARRWANEQKVETLKIRQTMNDKFSERLESARLRMEKEDAEIAAKK